MEHSNGNGHSERQDPDQNFPLVLVVEDRERDLEYTVGLLNRNGFRVVEASSYEEAVRELGRQRFAAIVCDYWLTDDRMGESGEDVLRVAREMQPGAVRVVFTAYNIGEGVADRVGGRWFDKSNTASGLVALVRAAVNRAGMI